MDSNGFIHGNDNDERMDTINLPKNKEVNEAKNSLNGSDIKNTDTVPKPVIDNDQWNKVSNSVVLYDKDDVNYSIIDIAVVKEMGVVHFYMTTGNIKDLSKYNWTISEAKSLLNEKKYNDYKDVILKEIQIAYKEYVDNLETTIFQFRAESYIELSEIKNIKIQL